MKTEKEYKDLTIKEFTKAAEIYETAAAWISAGNLWMMGGLLVICSKQH